MDRSASEGCSAETIYKTIKDRIALLDYKPGEPLREQELQEEFNCSRTPIREAFITLSADDLVERIPRSGTYVSQVSFRDLKELLLIRKHLLSLVGELVAKNITRSELEELEKLVEEMKNTHDSRKLIEMDLNFHRKVDSATHNQYLRDILETLEVQATRIWLFAIDRSVAQEFSEDFTKLLEALKQNDGERSGRILRSHGQKTIDSLSGELRDI